MENKQNYVYLHEHVAQCLIYYYLKKKMFVVKWSDNDRLSHGNQLSILQNVCDIPMLSSTVSSKWCVSLHDFG